MLLVLSLTQALVVVDGIPVAVALPSVGRDLALSTTELQWVVNGYVVTVAGGLLVLGRCADLFGRRRLLLLGLATLTGATLVAGLAPTGPLLVVARAFQGLGAAMALPASLALVPALFVGPGRRDRAFATIAVVESAAWVIGALSGGILTATLGWRFVFLVTVPVAGVALVLAARVLPESRDERAPGRLDLAGAVTITAGLAAGVHAISRFDGSGAGAGSLLVAIGVSAAFLGAFVVIERVATEPLIRPGLLRVRRLWGASVGVAANTVAYSAAVFIGTLYLQGTGYGAAATGLFFLPLAVGAFASPWFARLLSRCDARPVALAGLLTGAAGLATFACLAQLGRPHPAAVLLTLLLFGIGQYAAWVALVGQATSDVGRSEYGAASGIFKTSTHVGAAVAVAISAALIESAGHTSAVDRYALAYLTAAACIVLGAVAVGALLRPAAKGR